MLTQRHPGLSPPSTHHALLHSLTLYFSTHHFILLSPLPLSRPQRCPPLLFLVLPCPRVSLSLSSPVSRWRHCVHLCVIWFCVFRFLFCVQSSSCHYCCLCVSTLLVSRFAIKPLFSTWLRPLLRLGPTPSHSVTPSLFPEPLPHPPTPPLPPYLPHSHLKDTTHLSPLLHLSGERSFCTSPLILLKI